MSRVRADRYTNREGTGAPTFSQGVNIVGMTSITGVGSTALLVNGDARVTGVLTVGQGSVTISGDSITGVTTAGITTAYVNSINNLNYPTAGPLSNRNLIMNGAMAVSQKATATGLTNGDSNTYVVDRFGFMESGSPSYEFTYSQDTDVPANQGFANSLKWLCTTADTSLDSNERLRIRQGFEGQNLQCIKKGTPNAETLTLSFWVKTNLSGDISVVMEDANNSRIISKNATIAAGEVDTWVYKTIVFPGDTTGTLNNDNGASIYLEWYVKAGTLYTDGTQATTWADDTTGNKASANNIDLGSAVNNYINMTGVQLEIGERATPFEHRSYGEELALCQRYFQTYDVGSYGSLGFVGRKSGSGTVEFDFIIPHPMRAQASGAWTGTLNGFRLTRASDGSTAVPTAVSIVGYNNSPYNTIEFEASTTSFSTTDIILQHATASGNQQSFTLDAEL